MMTLTLLFWLLLTVVCGKLIVLFIIDIDNPLTDDDVRLLLVEAVDTEGNLLTVIDGETDIGIDDWYWLCWWNWWCSVWRYC